jgi:hypothetical protein
MTLSWARAAEVTNISGQGLWILVFGKEYFLSYKDSLVQRGNDFSIVKLETSVLAGTGC